MPPRRHLYLAGILAFANAFRPSPERKKSKLFVVGELREELGSFRSKIAMELNEHVFKDTNTKALTADIGLHFVISQKGVRVLCSACQLDNDLTERERSHAPVDIREVCVKGEGEGMFYNCYYHDPSERRHPTFLERVERYNVFGR